jgi:hypothetical protein
MASSYSRPGVFVNQSLTPLAVSTGGSTGSSVAVFAAPYNIGPIEPTFVTSFQQYASLYGNFNVANGSPLAYAVYMYFQNGGTGCYVLRVPNTDATAGSAIIASVAETDATPVTANVLELTALSPGAWSSRLYYEIVPGNPASGASGNGNSVADGTVTFTLNLYSGGTAANNLVETWPSVSLSPSSQRYLPSLINATTAGSSYVSVTVPNTYTAGGDYDPLGNSGSPTALSSGSDGTTVPTGGASGLGQYVVSGYAGTGWNVKGLMSLPGNQVYNINLPGATAAGDIAAVNYVIVNYAEALGNSFVVVDGPTASPTSTSAAVAANYVGMLSGGSAVTASVQSVLYAPWISIPDPAVASPNATRWVAPGGAILGQWAANDAQYTVAQAPAGIQAPVQAATLEASFSTTDLSTLQAYGINPIKAIPGSGFCIFGAQTLQAGYPNQFLNVARTLTQFVSDFQNLTLFAVFQNNDATLWASITAILSNYLNNAMQQGMLAGTTAATSYSITCDDTVNTPSSIAAGIVNVQVAVALQTPAEFVVINLSQMQSGSSISIS